MSDCKSNSKNNVTNTSGLNSISKILKILNSVFSLGQTPAPTIPPFLLLIGAEQRPGMSARDLAANVISRMESDCGIPMGDIFADGPNAISESILVQAQEQITHIKTKGKVTTIVAPQKQANPALPIIIQGIGILE